MVVCIERRLYFLAGVFLRIGGYFSQICWAICFVKIGQIGNEGVIGVRIVHERGNTEKQFRNSKSRAPFVFKDIDTNAAT